MSEELSKEEESWNEWLQMPQTKMLRQWAQKSKLELMEAWASGQFSGAFDTEMLVKNAGATGACSIWDKVMELDYKEVFQGAKDA